MQSIIRNNENGILVPPADAKALSDAIAKLYKDTDTCARMGLEGFNDANGKYSRETIYQKLYEIYQSCLS